MRILRDEGGNALLGLVAEAPGKAGSASQGVQVQHCCFHCRWCGAIISLPHDRLGLMFAGPAIRKINLRSIATVCISCRQVAGYSLFRGAYGYDTRHKFASVHPVGTTMLADWLHCEETSCRYPLPLFVMSEGELSGKLVQELGKGWEWDGLTCASGHPIKPPIWLCEKAPLQFPKQLK